MTESNIRRASLAEIKRMKDEGRLFPNKGTHEPGEDLGPEFWAEAVLTLPKKPKSVHLKLDPEVFDYFVAITKGKGHLTRMQAVLKAYVEANGVCQRSCQPISCGVSDFRGADFAFGIEPDGSGGLPVAGFT